MGKKRQPFYRIVAADSRRARDGRFLEVLGTYNPIPKPAEVKLFEDRVAHWLDEGAIPSDTVRSLFTQVGYIEKLHSAKAGVDISEIEIKTNITERHKKTRKVKKAAIAAAEATAAEEKAAADAKAAEEKAAAEAKAAEEKAAAEAKAAEAEAEGGEKVE